MAESERMRGNRPPVTNYKVGDGSVKDLFRYIIGEDMPVQKLNGKKKFTKVKNADEKTIIRNDIESNIKNVSEKRFTPIIPPYVEVRDLPPEGMEFYRTGMPDKAMGIRGSVSGAKPPELIDPVYGEVIQPPTFSAPPKTSTFSNPPEMDEKDDRNYIGEFGKGFGDVGQQKSSSPPSIAKKIINAIYTFGGVLNAPSTKDIVMAIGPENISAEENAEINEVKYYLDRYPEIMELSRQLKRPPSQQEVIAIIKEYESKGKIKPKKPYLMKAYGGKIKKKKKKKLAKGGKVTSYNY